MLEMTKNRMENLAFYGGEITIEGEAQNEIVVRINFGDGEGATRAAEAAYNVLLDIEDERCDICGRYEVHLRNGLCRSCNRDQKAQWY